MLFMKKVAAVLPLVLFALHAQTDNTRFHLLGAKEPLTGPSARPAREIAREYIDGISSPRYKETSPGALALNVIEC